MSLVTAQNLDLLKSRTPCDIADELIPGCDVWWSHGGHGSKVTLARWPNDRGAICFGGDSVWGAWCADGFLCLDDGNIYDEHGNLVVSEEDNG